MDLTQQLRTFLNVARLGSFSAAAREAGTVPSVISKRISQLEHLCRAPLFIRSTRGLILTPIGRNCQRRFAELLADIDAAIHFGEREDWLQEHLRVKCPTTMSIMHVSKVIFEFQRVHPGVRIDLDLVDRSLNPLEEGYDLAIGAMPATYPDVHDITLCRLTRKLVASPGYLETRSSPQHPRDLASHNCIVFQTSGSVWTFVGPEQDVEVEANTIFSSTDSRILCQAALSGIGVAILADHTIQNHMSDGDLVELLPDWKVPDLFLKVLVPERRLRNPAVDALVTALTDATQPTPPWDAV